MRYFDVDCTEIRGIESGVDHLRYRYVDFLEVSQLRTADVLGGEQVKNIYGSPLPRVCVFLK